MSMPVKQRIFIAIMLTRRWNGDIPRTPEYALKCAREAFDQSLVTLKPQDTSDYTTDDYLLDLANEVVEANLISGGCSSPPSCSSPYPTPS